MTDKFYRREIYLFQTLMRCCLWYALAILISYYLYQHGRGEFHPFRLLLIFPECLALWAIRNFVKQRKLCVLCIIVSAALMAVFLPIPWYLPTGEAFLLLFAFYRRRGNQREFGAFWETWVPGVVLLLLILLFHMLSTQNLRPKVSISPTYASRFILFFFGLFLVFYVLYGYMKNFHEYFVGRGTIIGEEAFLRARRSNYIMVFILLLAGAVIMFLFTFLPLGIYQALWNAVKSLFARLLGIAFSSMDQLGSGANGNSIGSGMGDVTPEVTPHINAAEPASGIGGQILGVLFILGILFVIVWFLLRFFKGVLANYQAGTDTAEFVSIHSREEEIYGEKRSRSLFYKKFGNSNREKVRKYYYQTMLKRFGRMSSEQKANVRTGQTPKDWSNLFANSPDDRKRLWELTEYYEKARFGKDDCTEEEAEAARELAQRMEKKT